MKKQTINSMSDQQLMAKVSEISTVMTEMHRVGDMIQWHAMWKVRDRLNNEMKERGAASMLIAKVANDFGIQF